MTSVYDIILNKCVWLATFDDFALTSLWLARSNLNDFLL